MAGEGENTFALHSPVEAKKWSYRLVISTTIPSLLAFRSIVKYQSRSLSDFGVFWISG